MSDYYLKVCIGLHFLFEEYKIITRVKGMFITLIGMLMFVAVGTIIVIYSSNRNNYVTEDNVTAKSIFPLWCDANIIHLDRLTPVYSVKEVTEDGAERMYTLYRANNTAFTVYQPHDEKVKKLSELNKTLKGK